MKPTFKRCAAVLCLFALVFGASCAKKEAPQEVQTVQFPADEFSVTLPIYAVVEERTPDATLSYSGFIFDRYDLSLIHI